MGRLREQKAFHGMGELDAAIDRCRLDCQRYNQIPADRLEEKRACLKEFLYAIGVHSVIQQPFYCDLGNSITIGNNVFINYNCTFLDISPIHIGDDTLIGPNVGLYTASHPVDPEKRKAGECWSAPIEIGKNVWIGGSSVILPGVTIGDNAVIGAGSVVTHDVAPNTIVAGNPARVVKRLD